MTSNPLPDLERPDERPESERVAAMAAIRRFRDCLDLPVFFIAVAVNPYAGDCRTMEIYEDQNGYEYWLDPGDDRLIQAAPSARQPAAPHKTRPENRIPVAELRQLALSLIERNVPGFRETISRYHPLEDNRDREIYFFRFDDFNTPVPESELPPFVQVGLRADGRLVSFTDTLIRPESEAASN
jgi:hypothetical protein